MVWAAALALTLAGEPWEKYISDPLLSEEGVVWAYATGSGTTYYVTQDEVTGGSWGVTVWMHGYHRMDKAVSYRSSLWHITLDCKGYYSTSAGSTYAPDGQALSEWDAVGRQTAIRPGTMYDSMQDRLCPKK